MSDLRFDPEDPGVFLKQGPLSALAMFEAEADGLRELAGTGEVRVPNVIGCGEVNGKSYIAMERLQLQRAKPAVEPLFGRQLAALHRHSHERFGWFRNNTIGVTPQHNDQSGNWIEFFRERRLAFQLHLAVSNGYGNELQESGNRLLHRLPEWFSGYQPAASLLHGDLWAGNWGCADGVPVIFDPAVYYGDRESDIAMTRLFGGFGNAFYEAYDAAWPMAPGHEDRQKLYQLYHVLNHLNLFGRSYLGQASNLIETLLRTRKLT